MDREIIENRIEYIKEKIKDINFEILKYDETLDKRIKKTHLAAAERWAEEIIESAININNEILKDFGKISESYYESFLELKVIDLFDDEFLEKIANTAGFRNRLAHEYMSLNEEITINSIKNIPVLYKNYLIEINKFVLK